MTITAERYHDISCGHRVHGHESKCAHLHGHNYRVHFVCEASKVLVDNGMPLDELGRVVDFSVIKARLCMWLEDQWDHKFLAWEHDPLMREVALACGHGADNDYLEAWRMMTASVVWVPFNPTAENMAKYLVEVIAPDALAGTGVRLVECRIEETRKCSATYTKEA